jgi:hypothetical protein
MVKRLALLLVVIAGLAGCAQNTPPSTLPATAPVSAPPSAAVPPADSPTTSPTAVPTWGRPTRPAKDPSDRIKKTDTVVGMVTKGGAGPCYGVTTDDGTQYSLHSAAGLQLPKGKYVKVRAVPSDLRIYCGPGELLDLLGVESIN